MAYLLHFVSARFDPKGEPENPINPIAGHSVLTWLREKLGGSFNVSEPDSEDWGWYCDVEQAGHRYLLGASADLEEEGPPAWTVQIHRQRGLVQKLLGRNQLSADDPLIAAVHRALERDPDVGKIEIDSDL